MVLCFYKHFNTFWMIFFWFLPLTLLPPTHQIFILLNKSYKRFSNILRNVYDIVAHYRSLGKTRLLTILNLPCFGIGKNKPYAQEWKKSCCKISRIINLVVTFSDRVLSRVLKEGGNLHPGRPFLNLFFFIFEEFCLNKSCLFRMSSEVFFILEYGLVIKRDYF